MGDVSASTQQGIEAVRLGDPVRGRTLLSQAVTQNPHDELAWLWLSSIVDNSDQQLECLQRVLQINPFNHAARRDLAAMPVRFHAQVPGIPVFRSPTPSNTSTQAPTPVPIGATAMGSAVGAIAAGTAASAISAGPVALPSMSDPYGSAGIDPALMGGATFSPVTGTGTGSQQSTVAPAPRTTTKSFGSVRNLSLGALPYVALALILLAMIGGLLGTIGSDLVQYRRRSQAPSAPPATTAVTATTTATASATVTAKSAAVTISNVWGQLTIPGNGFIDGRVAGANPPATRSDVWIWDRPFETGQLRCKLVHGTPVLLLELATSPEGHHAVRIQHDDCTGWVDADLLNTVAAPAEGIMLNNDQWHLGK